MSQSPSMVPISIRDEMCAPALVVIHDDRGRDARFETPILGRLKSKRMLGDSVLSLRCEVIGGDDIVVPAGFVSAAGPVALVSTSPAVPLQ